MIPVVDGAVSAEGVRRINVGGFQMIAHLQRALQLKYTAHAGNITVGISTFKAEQVKWLPFAILNNLYPLTPW